MGAGVVYAVIIAMWAIVLIPMWLQRHDQVSEVRSADRFQVAMRRLRSSRFVEASAPPTSAPPAVKPVHRTKAQRTAARRRRSVLLVLVLTTLLAAATGFIGVAPLWAPGIPGLLLVVFLAAAFAAAQRQSQGTAPRVVAKLPTPAPASFAGDHRVSLPLAVGLPEGAWAPTATPLPTYVNAPAATRVPRLLDLRTPGKWTSAAMLEQVAAARSTKVRMNSFADLFVDDVTTVDVGSDDLDSVIERRAVNG